MLASNIDLDLSVEREEYVYLTSNNPLSRSAKRYPARIILLSAIRLALIAYPAGSIGAA